MLSDRVLVLSPRPAEVLADIAIDLPRPRTPEDARSPAFGALVDQVFAALSRGMAHCVTNRWPHNERMRRRTRHRSGTGPDARGPALAFCSSSPLGNSPRARLADSFVLAAPSEVAIYLLAQPQLMPARSERDPEQRGRGVRARQCRSTRPRRHRPGLAAERAPRDGRGTCWSSACRWWRPGRSCA